MSTGPKKQHTSETKLAFHRIAVSQPSLATFTKLVSDIFKKSGNIQKIKNNEHPQFYKIMN